MNKIKTLGIGLLLAAGLFASAKAQTNETTLDQVISLLGSPTNYAIEPYATYAPKAPTKIGGGVLALYNVNQNVGLGLGVDWLGHFSMVSGNLTLGLPFHPLKAQFPSLIVIPGVIVGVGAAYSGNGNFNGSVSAIYDATLALKFGHVLGGQMNTGIAYGQWTGGGPYDVKRYHLFLGWSHGF